MPDGSSVEWTARQIPTVPNLSPIFSELGEGWCLGQTPLGNCPGFTRPRKNRHHRMLHWWNFRKCQKRGLSIGKTKKGKGTKIMAIADASGLPLSVWTTGASTHEVKLVEQTIDKRFIREKPKRLIGDLAYDSDPLDHRLKKKRIKLIAPHKSNRRKQPTQDGRELRRYCRRWKVERLFAWIQNFRRCVVRYEVKPENYLAFVQFSCFLIITNYFWDGF